MERFALIDLNSGYVWDVVNEEMPAAACAESDRTISGEGRQYREITRSEINTTAGGFAVHRAPAGYCCYDGQDAAEIARVATMPLAGYYRAL